MSLVVVGSVNVDIVASVERIPAPGETVLGHSVARGGGGKGANQAIAASRAGGAEVAFVGAVGADSEGDFARQQLISAGIATSGLTVDESSQTGMAFISVDAEGENSIVVVAGANSRLAHLQPNQREVVSAAQVLVSQLEIPVSLVEEAALARADGTIFVLNAAPAEPLALRPDLLRLVDVLVVNQHEALQVAGVAEIEEALAVLSGRVPALVVTLGGEGSLVVCGDDQARVEAFEVEAVDTTGAGDTYCGALAAYLEAALGEKPGVSLPVLVEAARTATAAAALAVTRPGAQTGVPQQVEVEALLSRTPE